MRTSRSLWLLTVAAAAALTSAAASTHAQVLTYSGSVQYATGDYLFPERRWPGRTPIARPRRAVKAPLASASSGFGTGQWDYGGGIATAGLLGGPFLLADATYWVLGDAPGLRLRNTLAYGVSVGRPSRDGRFAMMASATGSTSALSGVVAPVQVGLGAGYRPASGRALSASAAIGLTRSAPDVTLGMGWSVPLR